MIAAFVVCRRNASVARAFCASQLRAGAWWTWRVFVDGYLRP